jgi:hypothetical protein
VWGKSEAEWIGIIGKEKVMAELALQRRPERDDHFSQVLA